MAAGRNYKISGRKDGQVKIRGYRVEIGDVEKTLSELPTIREIVVIAKDEEEGYKSLCAFYVADEEIEPVRVREYAEATLPAYMVPSYFIPIERIPLTSNGKTNRIELLTQPTINYSLVSQSLQISNKVFSISGKRFWEGIR